MQAGRWIRRELMLACGRKAIPNEKSWYYYCVPEK
jgi:hypothetical protein